MASLKSLNSAGRKKTQKAKNNTQRETFFGKSFDTNEKQFQVDSLSETGPYIAKVLFVYNEDGVGDSAGKIVHDGGWAGVLANIGNFLGVFGSQAKAVLTVKARLVDVSDAAIPEPKLIGKEALLSETDKESIVLIEMHDTFTALTQETNELKLKAGDLIIVDFRDKKNKKNGYIVGKYWDSPVDSLAEELASSVDAVSDAARAAVSGVVASVTNKNGGKCGYVYQEADCVQGQTISYTVNNVTIRDKDNVVKRLEALKKSNISSLKDYKIVEDKGTYAIFDLYYELTKHQKMCGHPKYVKLVQKMFEQVVDKYVKTGFSNPRPHVPALIVIRDSCRTFEYQLGLRKKYCKYDTEAKYLSNDQSKCTRAVGQPSRAVVPGHQRGEALDFQFVDIKIFESTNRLEYIPNNSAKENREDLQRQFDHEVRRAIASMPKILVDGEELTHAPLLDGTEGWHFSTNGR